MKEIDKITSKISPTPVVSHEKLAVRGKLVRMGGRKQAGLVLEPHGPWCTSLWVRSMPQGVDAGMWTHNTSSIMNPLVVLGFHEALLFRTPQSIVLLFFGLITVK